MVMMKIMETKRKERKCVGENKPILISREDAWKVFNYRKNSQRAVQCLMTDIVFTLKTFFWHEKWQ